MNIFPYFYFNIFKKQNIIIIFDLFFLQTIYVTIYKIKEKSMNANIKLKKKKRDYGNLLL